MVNGWKVTAIVCILLLIAETSLIVWAYNYGTESIDNKIKCSNEICFNIDSSAFIYDEYTNTCECYQGEEVIHREIIE